MDQNGYSTYFPLREEGRGYRMKGTARPLNINTRVLTPSPFNEPKPPSSELSLAVGALRLLSTEVKVHDFTPLEIKGLKNYKVLSAVDPSNFYLECLASTPKNPGVQFISERMTIFYEENGDDRDALIQGNRVFKYRCYALNNFETNQWERVRISELKNACRRAKAYRLDYGDFAVCSFDDLRELRPEFGAWSAVALQASLFDCNPIGPLGNSWNEEAINMFKQIVLDKNKIFHGVIMAREKISANNGIKDDTKLLLGVILIEKGAEESVSATLGKLKLAECDGIPFGWRDMFQASWRITPKFDIEEFEKYKAAHQKCFPSAPTKSLDRSRQHQTSQGIKTKTCPACKVLSFGAYCSREDENLVVLPTEIIMKLGLIRLTNIISPSCFYVQMRHDKTSLYDMLGELENLMLIEGGNFSSIDKVQVGSFVAVKLMEPIDTFDWHRAIVTQVVQVSRVIRVVLIDYGINTSLQYYCAKALPKYFCRISAFATRCHLDAFCIAPRGPGVNWFGDGGDLAWSSDAKRIFKSFINQWNHHSPRYFAWRHSKSEIIPLNEFHQEVEMSANFSRWTLAPLENNPEFKLFNSMKDNKILSSLFNSFGIDIAYEAATTGVLNPYKVERVVKLLVDKGFAKKINYEENDDEDEMEEVQSANDSGISA